MSESTKNRLLKEFYELPVKELMEDISHVFSILSGKNHVWVVDNKKNMKLVGVITEHDVLSVISPARIPPYVFGKPDLRSLQYGLTKTAEDTMSKKPITGSPEEKVTDVLSKMKRCQVRRIPVVDKKQKLVGEITLHHLIYKYYKATQYHPLVE